MNKPVGQWKCRACGEKWQGSQLYQDPMFTVTVWTCGYLECGGVCDRIPSEIAAEHNAHLTPESLASSQAVVNASALEQSDSVPPPAQAQVA